MSTFYGETLRPFDGAIDLDPPMVESFLRTTGWVEDAVREGVSAIWHNDQQDASLLLPYDREFRDFKDRFNDALLILSNVLGIRDSQALALEIATATHDIWFLRADQFARHGSIPLLEAKGLIDGAEKLLLAAACNTIRPPRASNAGRKPTGAKEFIQDDVRMGHTLRGSFVLTILARHHDDDEPEVEAESPALSEPRAEAEAVPQVEDEHHEPSPVSFTRRVMSTLATSLDAAQSAMSQDKRFTIDEAVAQGASVEVFEALNSMSQFEGVRSLDMNFRWSPVGPPPTAPEKILVPRTNPDRVEVITSRLKTTPEIVQDVVMGQVVSLERAEDQDEGVVVIDGLVGQSRRKVRMALTGDAYRTALRSHDRREPVIASGTVAYEKRRWWLRDAVTIKRANEALAAPSNNE